MKYSKKFEKDFRWYLSVRHKFNFDGSLEKNIVFDRNGIDGKMCFFLFDSTGKLKPTKHPNLFKALLKTKGSANLHIKMYAEDRAYGRLPKFEFSGDGQTLEWIDGKPVIGDCIKKRFNLPDWFVNAVEQQKYKYYPQAFPEAFK